MQILSSCIMGVTHEYLSVYTIGHLDPQAGSYLWP